MLVINDFRGPYAFLSNFHVEPDGKTVEHFFQAAKATNARDMREILAAPSARDAKRLGRRVVLREDWEFIKDDIMLDLLRHKFSRPHLREALLATDDAHLVEGNTWGDTYWGVCNGVGQNKLGQLLEQVRHELAASHGQDAAD